jgi:hypothetical protein
MSRKFLIPFLAAAFLAAPAFAPLAMPGVSDSAMAATAKSGTAKRKFITKDLPEGGTKKRIFDRWGNQVTIRKAGDNTRRVGGGGGKGGPAYQNPQPEPPGRPKIRR